MDTFEFIIGAENTGERVDKFLSLNLKNISRSYIHKLIETGMIKINNKSLSKNHRLNENDTVVVNIPDPEVLDAVSQNIPLNIVYEDDNLLVVDKPKGLVVHPAPGNHSGTLVNALLCHCKDSLSGINGALRPGIVHRIDKDTSGLLIIAKNDYSHKMLAKQIKEHSFTREYEAVVYGNIKNDSGTINTNIGRHRINRKKMAVLNIGGKNAVTHFKIINMYPGFTHVKLRLKTGRTHQIRVHMAHIGHAVVGDEVYSNPKNNPFKFLKGQCLHAKTLGFIHPTTKKYMEFTSPLPDYFQKVLNQISSL